uniref:Uncharacterized protein n=1 Tax=Cucumis melo TaxID=3656 RepID=A0A9I9D9G8_CUCME
YKELGNFRCYPTSIFVPKGIRKTSPDIKIDIGKTVGRNASGELFSTCKWDSVENALFLTPASMPTDGRRRQWCTHNVLSTRQAYLSPEAVLEKLVRMLSSRRRGKGVILDALCASGEILIYISIILFYLLS